MNFPGFVVSQIWKKLSTMSRRFFLYFWSRVCRQCFTILRDFTRSGNLFPHVGAEQNFFLAPFIRVSHIFNGLKCGECQAKYCSFTLKNYHQKILAQSNNIFIHLILIKCQNFNWFEVYEMERDRTIFLAVFLIEKTSCY